MHFRHHFFILFGSRLALSGHNILDLGSKRSRSSLTFQPLSPSLADSPAAACASALHATHAHATCSPKPLQKTPTRPFPAQMHSPQHQLHQLRPWTAHCRRTLRYAVTCITSLKFAFRCDMTRSAGACRHVIMSSSAANAVRISILDICAGKFCVCGGVYDVGDSMVPGLCPYFTAASLFDV